MSTRTKARLIVLMGLSVLLWGRVAVLWGESGERFAFPPLIAEQIIDRSTLRAEGCRAAVIYASRPQAQLVNDHQQATIDADLAARLADSVLRDHFAADLPMNKVVSDPLLLRADFFGESRLMWSRLWLPIDDDGTPHQRATVLYVDAVMAAPALLFTDILITDPQAISCLHPAAPPTPRERYIMLSPLLLGVSIILILAGGLWEIRTRHQIIES